MRKILFRGKGIATGEWIFGDLLQWKSKDICAIVPQDGSEWSNPYDFEVVPETVGEFTGLYENACEDTYLNKPIFDGDKICFIDGEVLTVEWNDDTCVFQYSDGSPLNDGERYATHKEVIGNIHTP